MTRRVPTGIANLDPIIEGGFHEGSLILLAGTPGTGKTVFGMNFLLHGAMRSGEPGVLVSFAEGKKALTENVMRHFRCSIKDFDDIEILDFVAVKEKGLESVMEMIIRSIDAREAKRLVIDSFTAMTAGLEEKADARILAHALGKLVKQTSCTTILITETPMGTDKIGMGVEEFVADGVLTLARRVQEGRVIREMDILKLRGTRIERPKCLFTLEDGFQVFQRSAFKKPELRKEFKPRSDTETCFSSGSEDLDRLLGEGWRRGSMNLMETGSRIDVMALLNLIFITALNFVMHGDGFAVFDPLLFSANMVNECLMPILGNDRLNQLVRCFNLATYQPKESERFISKLKGEKLSVDMETICETLREIGFPDRPAICLISLDALVNYYRERNVTTILTSLMEEVARNNSLLFLSDLSNLGKIEALSNVATTHLKLEEVDGTVLLYGVKPETWYYAMEVDTSKGYPDLRLTPIL